MEQKNLENLTNPEQALLEQMEQLFPDMEPSRLAEGFDALVQAHPEADLAGLCTDELFIQYASGRSEPLDVLYESYRAGFMRAPNGQADPAPPEPPHRAQG